MILHMLSCLCLLFRDCRESFSAHKSWILLIGMFAWVITVCCAFVSFVSLFSVSDFQNASGWRTVRNEKWIKPGSLYRWIIWKGVLAEDWPEVPWIYKATVSFLCIITSVIEHWPRFFQTPCSLFLAEVGIETKVKQWPASFIGGCWSAACEQSAWLMYWSPFCQTKGGKGHGFSFLVSAKDRLLIKIY